MMTKEQILERIFKCESESDITNMDDVIAEVNKTDKETAQYLWKQLFMMEEGLLRQRHNSSTEMKNFNLTKFKDYVNTYDSQLGHKDYEVRTIIDDFLYGIGICLNEDEYKNADGYQRFQEVIIKHLDAKPKIIKRTKKDD